MWIWLNKRDVRFRTVQAVERVEHRRCRIAGADLDYAPGPVEMEHRAKHQRIREGKAIVGEMIAQPLCRLLLPTRRFEDRFGCPPEPVKTIQIDADAMECIAFNLALLCKMLPDSLRIDNRRIEMAGRIGHTPFHTLAFARIQQGPKRSLQTVFGADQFTVVLRFPWSRPAEQNCAEHIEQNFLIV